MKEDTVVEPVGREAFTDTLTDVLRIGAQQLLQQAVEIEFASFLSEFQERRLKIGGQVSYSMLSAARRCSESSCARMEVLELDSC